MWRNYLKIAQHLTHECRMSLVLLDRDGVINEDSPEYIKRPSEWAPIPGSLNAIARLNQIGRQVAVCSNQAGVARGLLTNDDLRDIHDTMRAALARFGGHIDAIYCCTHSADQHCACRKPEPGLLIRAMSEFGTPPDRTAFVGDSLRDMVAAIAARCMPVLVRTGNGSVAEPDARAIGVERVFDNLDAAVEWLLDQ